MAERNEFLLYNGLLKVGGHRINPDEVEGVLMESGLLVEVAVVGIPDPLLGTKLCALGVAKGEGCSEKEIMAFAAQRLPQRKYWCQSLNNVRLRETGMKISLSLSVPRQHKELCGTPSTFKHLLWEQR